MQKIALIGAGRLGSALALALDREGYVVTDLLYRSTPPPAEVLAILDQRPRVGTLSTRIDADIVIIATQDAEIANVAQELGSFLEDAPIVIHTSGSLSSGVLSPLSSRGCPVGSMHPLLSVSDPISGADRFSGSFFCIEGTPAALPTIQDLVAALGGRAFTVPAEKKAMYHAAAVTASGHIVALIDIAKQMLETCGAEGDPALEILGPLIRSAVENVAAQGVESSLTGTYARGDKETFEHHLSAIDTLENDNIRAIFLLLAQRSLEIAARLGSSRPSISELAELLSMAKKNGG
jgi:predicted short-subunit dehydrogenase-like oxidoreductase (DUF2520 family)